MIEAKYCVTARNRLTGDREVVTPAISKAQAKDIKLKYANMKGPRKAFTHPKVEVYIPKMSFSK